MKNNLILIVDDNAENLKVLSRILRSEGYQIAVANNGPKALEVSRKKDIDLILLDIMMPELNGFEVCKRLKAKPRTKDIPVIFISALKDTKKKVKGFKVGGRDYITKPFKSEVVMARVKAQLELNQTKKELEKQNMELEKLYKDLENEFEKARRLHQQFLPNELPKVQGLSYDTFFQPSDKLGGDFYDAIKLKDQLLIYLADVSGHGLDGSMMNIFLRETVNNYLLYKHQENTTLKPGDLISYVAKQYRIESFPAEYFICLLVGVVDIEEMEISFANAGFQFPPIKLSKTGGVSTLSCRGMPISSVVDEDIFSQVYKSNCQEKTVALVKGESIFVTTDGLLEEVVGEEIYGEERLNKVLAKNYKYPANLITTKIKKDFKEFAGSLSAQDDLTFLTLKRDLDIIDQFKRKIKSKLSEMYKVQEEILEFISPYYQTPSLICVGFQEIVINAMEHGNKMDPKKEVIIEIEVTKEYIKTTITDDGAGFDWSLVAEKELNIGNDSIDESERGRGIKISNKLYDELWYNEKGNQAYLLKLR